MTIETSRKITILFTAVLFTIIYVCSFSYPVYSVDTRCHEELRSLLYSMDSIMTNSSFKECITLNGKITIDVYSVGSDIPKTGEYPFTTTVFRKRYRMKTDVFTLIKDSNITCIILPKSKTIYLRTLPKEYAALTSIMSLRSFADSVVGYRKVTCTVGEKSTTIYSIGLPANTDGILSTLSFTFNKEIYPKEVELGYVKGQQTVKMHILYQSLHHDALCGEYPLKDITSTLFAHPGELRSEFKGYKILGMRK